MPPRRTSRPQRNEDASGLPGWAWTLIAIVVFIGIRIALRSAGR